MLLRRPPALKASHPLQLTTALVRNNLQLMRDMAVHGDVTEASMFGYRSVLLTHPEDIQTVLVTQHRNFRRRDRGDPLKEVLGEGLLTSEGTSHLERRRLMQPAFHREKIASYAELMVQHTRQRQSRWKHGMMLSIDDEMTAIALRIVGDTLFESDVAEDVGIIREAVDRSMKMVGYAILPFSNLVRYIPAPSIRAQQEAQHRLDALVARLIARRRSSQSDKGDLLSMLLSAQQADTHRDTMTDRQVHNEVITFLLAGYETTAVALSWAWYLLARHPEVEAQVHRELSGVLQGRLPTVDDVPALTYTRMVFAETLRLYPPAYVIPRQAVTDCEFRGYYVPRGTTVLVSPYLVQHDARWWPDPEQFNPSRWSPECKEHRHKFTYFPFGAGVHTCIGESFAWMEGVLVLATIAQRWRLQYAGTAEPTIDLGVTLRPQKGLRMQIFRRTTRKNNTG